MFPVCSNERAGSVDVNWNTVSTVRFLVAAFAGNATKPAVTTADESAMLAILLKFNFIYNAFPFAIGIEHKSRDFALQVWATLWKKSA
jgi:hypothetical protein